MTTYVINYTDPLKNGFSIPPGGFNGPGGSASSSTLQLYGRGALEWGEAVDENLVRLAENFAGASAPHFPIAGQFWFQVKYYYHNSAMAATAGWYRYNPNTKAWALLNGTGVVPGTQPVSPSVGQYYFDGTSLQGFYAQVAPEAPSFLARSHMVGTGGPGTRIPEQTLFVYDAYANSGAGAWVAPLTVAVTGGTAPISPQVGGLWYNQSTGKLFVWNGTVWKEILGPSASGTSVSTSHIDMGNTYRIINLPAPTTGTDAVNKTYVDNLLTTSLSGYLSTSGGTVTGSLVVTGATTVQGTFSASSTSKATFGGAVGLGGVLDMNNFRINELADGALATDAATVGQMNTAISNAISSYGSSSSSSIPQINTGGTYKAGDICVTGGKIYIALSSGTGLAPGGNWRQVWPATYS